MRRNIYTFTTLDYYMVGIFVFLISAFLVAGAVFSQDTSQQLPKFSPTVFKNIAVEEGFGGFAIPHENTYEHSTMMTASKGLVLVNGWALMKEYKTEDEIRLVAKIEAKTLQKDSRMCKASRILDVLKAKTGIKMYEVFKRKVCDG